MTSQVHVGYGRDVAVSANDARAPYVQVADELRALIADGTYAPGARLPSGRDLSELHSVALMTVQKALAMLRDEGVLVTNHGRGTFVAASPPDPTPASSEFVQISRQLGDLRTLLEETAQRLDDRLKALERSAGLEQDPPRSNPKDD